MINQSVRLCFIRHGMTAGNLEKRYVGRTDEPVLDMEKERLRRVLLPQLPFRFPKELYVSPMLRCRQTAAVLFPEIRQIAVTDLRECDFGLFEYKNYKELAMDPDYQRFIDTGGEAPFPEGESKAAFVSRCAMAFEQISGRWQKETCPESAAFVIHGGTIMALLDRFSGSGKDFYDWQVPNGGGFYCEWCPMTCRLSVIREL